jgi:hypothetical protein
MLGLAGPNVLGRKEAGEVLPDNFIGLKAKDAFCACVPTE